MDHVLYYKFVPIFEKSGCLIQSDVFYDPTDIHSR